ncbi:MAG: CHAT domain-containing tetratricopeptide repeat protein [Hellea sp.]
MKHFFLTISTMALLAGCQPIGPDKPSTSDEATQTSLDPKNIDVKQSPYWLNVTAETDEATRGITAFDSDKNVVVSADLALGAKAALKALESGSGGSALNDHLKRVEDAHAEILAAYSPMSPIVGFSYNTLGTAQFNSQKYEESLSNLRTALQIYKTSGFFPSKPAVSTQGNLSAILSQMQRHEEAKIESEKHKELLLAFFGSPSSEYAQYLFQQGVAQYHAGDMNKASEFLRISVDMYEQTIDKENEVELSLLIGYVSSYGTVVARTGDTDESLAQNQRAMTLAVEGLPIENATRAIALHNYGVALNNIARYSEAADVLRQAVDIRRKVMGPDHASTAYSVVALAFAEGRMGNLNVAETLTLKARDIFLKVGKAQGVAAATALGNAASFASEMGQHELAIKRYEMSIEETVQLTNADSQTLIAPQQNLIFEYLAIGEPKKALNRLELAESLINQHLPDTSPLAILNDIYKAILIEKKDSSTAMELADSAYKTSRELALNALIDPSETVKPVKYRGGFERYAEMSLANGRYPEAFEALQMSRISTLSENVRARNTRKALQGDEQKAALKIAQDKKKAVDAAIVAYSEAVATNDKDIVNKAKLDLDTSKTEFKKTIKSPNQSGGLDIGLASLSSIQSGLSVNEGVYITYHTGLFPKAILIKMDSVQAADIQVNRLDLEEKVTRLRRNLSSDSNPYNYALASEIYNDVFPKQIQNNLEGLTSLKVFSDNALDRLPLSVLWIEKPASQIPRDGEFFGSKFAVSILPSLSDIVSAKLSTTREPRYIGIGAPLLIANADVRDKSSAAKTGDYYYRSGIADFQSLSLLPPLPHAKSELESIGDTFKSFTTKLMTGKDATELDIKNADLDKYSIIVFATHGLVSGEFEGQSEPALVLTPPQKSDSEVSTGNDGLLTKTEIEGLFLNADWVVLSACNTAAGDSRNAKGLSGLASAFLYAGTDSLLVSHWPVRDDAAAFLTVNTVKNAQAGMSKAAALQKAMQDLRENTDIPNADHPAIWAPFVLVGQ